MVQYMKNIIWRSVLFFALATLVACSGITVSTDWDPAVDFSKFKSFTVLENKDPALNRLTGQRIISALVTELESKGLEQVKTEEKADLAIGFDVTTEQRTTYQTVHNNMGGTYGFHSNSARLHGTMGSSRTTAHTYTVGTLVIGVYETAKKELIWEGSASGTVSTTSRSPEQNQQRINEAVQKILENFPPAASK